MKLKCRPEDFRVEEKLRLKLKRRGRHTVYRLAKRLWNTLDVIRDLERRHGLRRVSRAGLKDRYSDSIQYLSVPGPGPDRISASNYRLTRIGFADEPVSLDVLAGNRFTVTVRALTGAETETAAGRLPEIARSGVPNYYDEQRLGSARHGEGFIARRLVAGHLNGALRLWLATPSPADDSRQRRRHREIEANWGHWGRCLAAAAPEARPVFQHLVRSPRDFEGAVRLIPRPLLELFVNAYQAWLWNEVCAGVLERTCAGLLSVPYSHGKFLFYERPDQRQFRYLSRLIIPAPGPKAQFSSDRVAEVTADVLRREGLELGRLKLPFRIRGLYFKPWDRDAIIVPSGIRADRPKHDEQYPGRLSLRLTFFLPPGSYATIVIKRMFLG